METRTAYEAADIFLRQNGYELEVREDELVEFMVAVAEGHHRLPSIAEWIRENMKKRQVDRHARRRRDVTDEVPDDGQGTLDEELLRHFREPYEKNRAAMERLAKL